MTHHRATVINDSKLQFSDEGNLFLVIDALKRLQIRYCLRAGVTRSQCSLRRKDGRQTELEMQCKAAAALASLFPRRRR